MIWVECGEDVKPSDRVLAEVQGTTVSGTVYVAPDQLLAGDVHVGGRVVSIQSEPALGAQRLNLPGSDMPTLGSLVKASGIEGRVIQIDPVKRTVRLALPDESEIELEIDPE